MVFCFLTLLLFWSSTENSCLICQAAADNPNRKEGFDKTVKNKFRAGHSRTAIITTTSMVGIAVNALLAAVKVVIGQITGSLAVSFDGVYNLTDAGSSVITLISTKLAEREPDKQHPYGFGRTEYLSTFVIAMIILYAGISSLSESVQKLLRGGVPSYSSLSLWILLLAVVSKIGLGLFTISQGKKAGSGSLEASGKDALNDSVMSGAVLSCALLYRFSGIFLEAWVSLVIALFIIKSVIDITREALSKIIGARTDPAVAKNVKDEIMKMPGVTGACDLFFNDYGPDKKVASVHIEIPDTWTADQIDETSRRIEHAVWKKEHVILSAVGIYAKNTKDPESRKIEEKIRSILGHYLHILQMHGFYADYPQIRFDLIIDFNVKNRQEEYSEILEECRKAYPDHDVQITLDADVSD